MPLQAWDLESWRRYRDEDLRSEWSWLTLIGLFWLQEGVNSIGSAPDCAILLPKTAALIGHLELRGERIFLFPENDADFQIDHVVVHGETELLTDSQGLPTDLRLEDYSLTVIRRSGQLAVRLRDRESPVRSDFKGLRFFPTNSELKLQGTYTAYANPQQFRVATAIGREEAEAFSGFIEFSWQGKPVRLQAQERKGGEIFITFRDSTSGKTSYDACRFLLCPPPQNGLIDLDFNRAYNPPCSFTPYATCSLPHPDNRLDFAIEAGETTP